MEYVAGPGPASLAAADFNHDGALDVAVGDYSANTVSVLLNTVPRCSGKPEITHLHAYPHELWPPDDELVKVLIDYDATSSCGGPPVCKLSVTSNKPDHDDWRIVDAHHVFLRAAGHQREGRGPRRYNVAARCADPDGKTVTRHVVVTAPEHVGEHRPDE